MHFIYITRLIRNQQAEALKFTLKHSRKLPEALDGGGGWAGDCQWQKTPVPGLSCSVPRLHWGLGQCRWPGDSGLRAWEL